MEAPQNKLIATMIPLKHEWVEGNYPHWEWTFCRRCGVVLRADEANKDKECKPPTGVLR